MNNYLKILSYLKIYEEDEQYHNIEDVLVGMNKTTMYKVFRELKNEEFIKLIGGPASFYTTGVRVRFPFLEKSN